MGNVMASTADAESSRGRGHLSAGLRLPEAPQYSGGVPPQMVEALKAEAKKPELTNPGTLEELHSRCRDIQANTFEGAKIMVNKGLSNHFQVTHTINMNSAGPSGYRFGATYVGTKQYGPTEAFPVLLGEIDPMGNLNANVIHQLTSRLRCKFASQFQDSKLVGTQLTGDYRGRDYTLTLTMGNPGFFTSSGVFVCQYLQSVTKRLALGSEFAYHYGPNVPGRQVAVLSAVGRYAFGDTVWSCTLGPAGFHLSYYQKASDQLQIGVEVETNIRQQESTATVAYQIDLPKADLVFRGSLDSNWLISGVLEKRLQPLPFSLAISGRMNHQKNSFRLGCGLMIG
uniref:Mitochondrial import receptor subunit TOM40 homolog 2 n=2 Tax=Drosophila melanogaster TaxID=7227 RepID=TO402_DROME|eukprot:NP_610213.1 tomboy40 [Drosophila melanogaster]